MVLMQPKGYLGLGVIIDQRILVGSHGFSLYNYIHITFMNLYDEYGLKIVL